LAVDVSKISKPNVKIEIPKVEIIELNTKPKDSPFECFGCSS
jgi:hypothetical protein